MINEKIRFVRDVMRTDNFLLVDGLSTIHNAIRDIKEEDTIDLLIVEKRDEHDEIGIVLMSDIAKNVLAANRSPKRTNVYEVMSKPAITVSPDMQIKYCARFFERFGISIAPVVEENEVIGTVSYVNMVLKGMV